MVLPDLLEGSPLTLDDADAVDAACAQVRDFCNWHIAPSVTETVTVPVRSGVLSLPSLHVTEVVSVDGTTDGFTWTSDGVVRLSYGHHWSYRQTPAVVVFTHGYESCPLPVRQVVAQLASRGLVPEAQQKAVGPFTYYEAADPLLAAYPYRRLVVA